MTEYQDPNDRVHAFHSVISNMDMQATIPENSPLPSPTIASSSSSVSSLALVSPAAENAVPDQTTQHPRRPKLPVPRRSYSVTDHEPAPLGQPRPSARLGLLDLPSELHYTLFDFLDPIDSVCLGLTHSRLYAIHSRRNGTIPLCSRYAGPNDMEWAWRGAGPLLRPNTTPQPSAGDLEKLRVKGQVYCRKCGVSRCELHRHLKDWMGDGYEYCQTKMIYGAPAGPDAKPYCYLSSPKNPNRCGRHGGKRA